MYAENAHGLQYSVHPMCFYPHSRVQWIWRTFAENTKANMANGNTDGLAGDKNPI